MRIIPDDSFHIVDFTIKYKSNRVHVGFYDIGLLWYMIILHGECAYLWLVVGQGLQYLKNSMRKIYISNSISF